MTDAETRRFYDTAAGEYAAKFAKPAKPDSDLRAFMANLPAAGKVLDLGCGPGRSARLMMDAGFDVEAIDASEGMIEIAQALGVPARVATFSAPLAPKNYDGIFANFSLLHARRAEIPGLIDGLAQALRPGGTLHLGMKLGTGEARDRLGRFYSYVTEAELTDWIRKAGLRKGESRSFDVRGMTGDMEPAIIMRAHA